MKRAKMIFIPAIALAVCCTAFLCFSFATYGRLSKMASTSVVGKAHTIVIDAGHGGEDGGATGAGNQSEKDVNLAIAKDVQQILSASGYRVVMTRTSDTALSDPLKTIHERKTSDIHNRMKMIEAQGDCIFLSIHQNHFEQEQYHGTQVFYSKNNPDSKDLAEAIRGRVVSLLQTDNKREAKPATNSIYLLWHAKVPSVLVECGFLSNREEAKKLADSDYQKQMAFAICCGLLDFCSAKN